MVMICLCVADGASVNMSQDCTNELLGSLKPQNKSEQKPAIVAEGSLDANYVEGTIGTFVGPVVLMYGYRLQAVVTALNACFAANVFGVMAKLQAANCPSDVDPQLPKELIKVFFAMVTIATVGLKKGVTSLILKVAVVSAMMQDSLVTLIERVPLTEAQAGVANAASAATVTFIASTLAVGAAPAAVAAATVTIVSGLLGSLLKRKNVLIKCNSRTPRGGSRSRAKQDRYG